ncbi:HORMA domain-containing protein [Xylariales sp. AK1849]|nr:HORMA domain-containing protein [Xylariales sp. AK1849]
MPPTDPQSQPLSISLPQASHVLVSFTHFLTVAIHNILYYRHLYPSSTFLTARAYNLPVHQSRHPKVCTWIRDAVDAIKAQLILGSVQRIAIVIHDSETQVLERWMIDVAGFPAFKGVKEPKGSRRDEEDDGLGRPETREGGAATAEGKINWTDVDESFRGAVRRMAFAGEKMGPLPEGCSFTVAVELGEEGEAPIGYPQHWIPSQPDLQTQSKERPVAGKDVGGTKTTPLRSVEAGPLFFECWVEEGNAKEEATASLTSSHS